LAVSINFHKLDYTKYYYAMCITTNLTEEERRKCCVCDSKLHGRSDKVFCNYKCKNKAYAQHRKDAYAAGSQPIKRLNRNYYILCYLKGENADKFCISKSELRRLGFYFDVVSGIEQNKFGLKFHVFEFSWYPVNNQNIMVYRNSDEQPISPYIYKRWERHMKHKETPF